MENLDNIQTIIWDADNTIWNWTRYAANAYQGMADCIAHQTGIPEPQVAAAMKQYYTTAGTVEDAGLVQGMAAAGFFQNRHIHEGELIEEVRTVFRAVRNRYLRNFKGMKDILQKVQESGRNNIIITDAPAFHAQRRITRSKIAPFLKEVYAIQGKKPEQLPKDVREKEERGEYKPSFSLHELEVEKPHTPLEEVLKIMAETNEGVRQYIREHVAIIGDNDKKDMELARRYDCLGIHALWGKPAPEDLNILIKFAPLSVAARNMNIGAEETTQTASIQKNKIIAAQKPENLIEILGLQR